MKNKNLLNWLWTDSHEKQSPQRFARYAAILIMLLTLGVGQMWGYANFWENGAGIVTYSINSGSDTNHSVNRSGVSTSDFGTVTAFWIKGWQFKMYNDGGNICDYGKMYYRIYLTSGSGGAYKELNKNSTTWWPNSTNNVYHNGGSLNINVLSGLVGGVYYFEYYFEAQGKFASGDADCKTQYLSNGGSNYKIKFKYDPKYTVTVSAGSNGSVASTSVTAGNIDAVTLPTATANTGYHFNNWTTASSNLTLGNTTSATTGTVKARAAGTVTANFAANTYTVAYNANDAQYPGTATGSTSSSSHTYGTAKALTSNGFSRAGYTFAGWATTPTGSVAYTNGQSVTNLTSTQGATVTLYAKWTENKSTITLDASPSGTGTFQVGGVTVTSTEAGVTTTPEVTAVPIAGYSFSGWSITGGATISSTTDNPTTVTGAGAGAAATLTATFEEDLTYYDVTFGVGTSYTSLGSISAMNNTTSSAISSGDDILRASNITFTATPNTGYVVEGWYTDAACTAGKHNAGSTTYTIASLSSDVTVYVKFVEKTWSVAFAAGTGGTVTTPAATPQTVGQVTGISIAATPATGYTFNSWSSSNGGSFTSGASTNSNTFKPTAETTVTASFTETMSALTTSCHYDAGNPGYAVPTVSGSATNVGYVTTRTITATAAGTGYTFAGWTLTNCTRTDGGAPTATSITICSNGDGAAASVVANYRANTYSVHFDPNDANYVGTATGTMSNQDFTYGVSQALTANGFSREGYTFAGWATTPTGAVAHTDGKTVSNLTSTNGATVTLYAKWTGKSYTVSLNDLEGTCATKSMEVTMGSTYGAGTPALPEAAAVTPPTGYVFDGWYTSAGGGTKVTGTTQVTNAFDHTLYAHYIQKAQVYFKNTLGWSKVYVTYDAYWDSSNPSKGSGNSGKTTHLMTLVAGTTDVYYDDIPDAILSSWKGSIVFYNEQQDNFDNFRKGQAVFRRDFDSDATMFVPVPNDPNKFTLNAGYGEAGTTYYSTDQVVDKSGDDVTNYRYQNGYWVRYNNVEAGYSLKGSWDSWGTDHYIVKETASGTTYTYTIRGLSANTTYQFKLFKHCATSNTYSSQFSNTSTMTSGNCSNWTFNAASTTGNAGIKTTVAGDYTFNFTFGDGEVKLSVDYPFKANDYKVIYSYTKDGAKTNESEIIKCRANGLDTISVFIHSSSDASSRSLKIAKCTGINASGVPTWNNSYATIDISSVSESGVYNFIITQDGSAAASGAYWNKYTGNYYIRTAAADGGWDMYKYRPDNLMTLSEYSLKQTLSAPYSHYFCKYIDNSTTEITFTIATDYSPSICPVMVGDETIGGSANKTLPVDKSASVRFMWNMETNATGRSYLKSAQGSRNARFLVLHGAEDDMIFNNDADGTAISASGDLAKNEKIFEDTENWVYECYIKAKPGAKVSLIAKYNDLDRYLIGGPSSWETIIGGTGESKYTMKVVYDFKTNRLMTAWVPSAGITEKLSNIDVIIERHNQDEVTTITFKKATAGSEAGSIEAKSVIGALRFDYEELVGRVASWTADTRAKMMFLVSFPFDVNISDIFGLNTNYGEAFIVQQYNGAKRAEKGFFQLDGTDTFWETLPVDSVMHAGVGYCVCMDNDYLNNDVGHLWDNKRAGSSIYLYFPSANGDIVINSDPKTVHVPAHECKINRTFNGGKLNHKYTDSNWNMMGVPIFQNHTGDDAAGTPGAIFTPNAYPSDTTGYMPGIGFFYEWRTDKSYTVQKAQGYEFKPMHGYLVQYAGDVTFTCATPVVASVAARRTPIEDDYELELQVLNTNEEVLNRTYVELREEACDTFALNEDLYLAMNKHDVNVYTFAGTYNVAANVLSVDNHIVPMGVVVRKEGTYTFSMPDNFSGEVILVDKFAQTRTNLAMTDYEIHLPAGTIDDRFELEININKVPTAIDGVTDGQGSLKDGKAHKFIMNDMMYILKDGVLYDARGNRVK